jgi:DNA adenine methylase
MDDKAFFREALRQEILRTIDLPNRIMAPFRWFGGKGNLVKWLLRYLPPREGITTYVEPFAGAASLLWHLPEPYPVEVLNDLDRRIVALFRVLQDRENFAELEHRLIWTPYARDEFRRALEILERWDEYDEVDWAWAFFVVQNQGFGGKAESESDWGRVLSHVSRGMAGITNSWRGRLKLLAWWHDRLTRVQVDSVDGIQAIQYWDTPETFFYVDPPYVLGTRKGGEYAHELEDEAHVQLVEVLLSVKGKVMLSGYPNDIYRRLEEAGWVQYDKETASHAAGRVRGSGLQGSGTARARVPRVESLWVNYLPPTAYANRPAPRSGTAAKLKGKPPIVREVAKEVVQGELGFWPSASLEAKGDFEGAKGE